MPKVLVIDDDDATKGLLQGAEVFLGADGLAITFVYASHDEQALGILKDDGDFDLALVNIDSSKITGIGLFKRLEGVRLRIPRVAMTSGQDLQSIRRAMNEGAADFLIKPLSFDDLQTTINRVHDDTERRRHAWKTEAQLAALRKELDIAGNIQQAILPNIFAEHPGLDVYAEVRPARDMSGDFYDFFDISEHEHFLVIADVAGKGIPAAFYMAVARTLVRAAALAGADPKQCLEQVNTALCRHDISGMFVSVFIAHIDRRTWVMTYANGGHLPPFVQRKPDGRVHSLDDGGDGVVLGVQEPLAYSQNRFQIEPGDKVLFYTDGLTEAFNAAREQFSDARVCTFLSTTEAQSAAELVDALFNDVHDFVGQAAQSDDITALVLHRR